MREWALNVNEGKSYTPRPLNEHELHDFEQARYDGPTRRTREAMIAYASARNRARWKRLQGDYAWLRKMMEEMDLNPDDAKFLL